MLHGLHKKIKVIFLFKPMFLKFCIMIEQNSPWLLEFESLLNDILFEISLNFKFFVFNLVQVRFWNKWNDPTELYNLVKLRNMTGKPEQTLKVYSFPK